MFRTLVLLKFRQLKESVPLRQEAQLRHVGLLCLPVFYPSSQDAFAFLQKCASSSPWVVEPIQFLNVTFRGSAHPIKELTAMVENSAPLWITGEKRLSLDWDALKIEEE
ncbi:hypothetical protein TNCV_4112511 [Trichonephila clavipes]|nr:hypothetical protein TNCV_4112511 [Trichonephila clavipes]